MKVEFWRIVSDVYICMHAQKKTIWGYRRFNHFSYAHIVDVLLVQKISMSLYYRQGQHIEDKISHLHCICFFNFTTFNIQLLV